MKGICVLLLVCVAYAAALPAPSDPQNGGLLEANPEAVESLEPAESRSWGGRGGHWGGHGGHGGWGHGGGYGYGGGWGRGGGWGHGGWRG